jgi:cyclopropane fatty-acyl-phospholipid synthase-like methyltransferase
MKRLLNLIKWAATMGREPQTFLGARWIHGVLKIVPANQKRIWALRVLSLSPHYFINQEEIGLRETVGAAFLEQMSSVLTESRQTVFDRLIKPHLQPFFTVIDYGCGPGYLSVATAKFVRKVYGVDISAGALDCARIINGAANIQYVFADGVLDETPDGGVDAVYSFAVVQHMTDEAFTQMLSICHRKLRVGGKLVLHVQLPDEVWQTEADWENDKSLQGHVKYKYGLHCFGRTESEYTDLVEQRGFKRVTLSPIAELFPESNDNLQSQRVLLATRS